MFPYCVYLLIFQRILVYYPSAAAPSREFIMSNLSVTETGSNHHGRSTQVNPQQAPIAIKKTCTSTVICPGPYRCGWLYCPRFQAPPSSEKCKCPEDTQTIITTCCRECLFWLCGSCRIDIGLDSYCCECASDISPP